MSYKIPEQRSDLFPLVSNETYRIKIQQNPVQGSLHDDLDAVTLIPLFPASIRQIEAELDHYAYVLFTLFLQSSPQGSYDPVPFYCLLLTMMKFVQRFYPGVTPSTWK